MNQLDDAMAAYNRAIEINPRYARAYANRGDIWRKKGQRENAIADYRYALSLDARNNLALAGLKTLGVSASASVPATPPPGAGQLNRRQVLRRSGRSVRRNNKPARHRLHRHRPSRAKEEEARAPASSCRRKAMS